MESGVELSLEFGVETLVILSERSESKDDRRFMNTSLHSSLSTLHSLCLRSFSIILCSVVSASFSPPSLSISPEATASLP